MIVGDFSTASDIFEGELEGVSLSLSPSLCQLCFHFHVIFQKKKTKANVDENDDDDDDAGFDAAFVRK